MHRTHTCWQLNEHHIDEKVTLSGWIANRRDHGGIIFIDLRDRYGLTQVVFDPQVHTKTAERIESARSEWVIKVHGKVRSRPDGQINKNIPTGAIEVLVTEVEILSKAKTPPFEISDHGNINEDIRLKYRYLDLRRTIQRQKIEFRAQVNAYARKWFASREFLEVQTPLFTVSSPEWARDYLIPSRLHPGKFYALPQAPQQYKQLLMVAGLDKYFQIAPCFRDEDPRADRHSCEFYQIDCEMSFVEQEDVLEVAENFVKDLVKDLCPNRDLVTPIFTRITHHDAIEKYGSDKPDLRFDCHFEDMNNIFSESEFSVFANAIKNGGVVKAMKLPGVAMSRKDIDEITELAVSQGAKWLAYILYEETGPKSPILKFINNDELRQLEEKLMPKVGDMIFFGADKRDLVNKVLWSVRVALRNKYNLVDPNTLSFAWVTDFPMFEQDEVTGKIDFAHNPFSSINATVEDLRIMDPMSIYGFQYDLTLNGYEILSGSIRNHDLALLTEAFRMVGRSEEEVKEKFGGMYEAFQYGVPPHGGFAFGVDRLIMILIGEDNIRDIYAFPKSGKAQDMVMNAPSEVDESSLRELHVRSISTSQDHRNPRGHQDY